MAGIDTTAIHSMVEQMRHAVAKAGIPQSLSTEDAAPSTSGVDFANALKAQLDQVNQTQQVSQDLGHRFSLGDESVNLSDVMIASQKAGIQMQTLIQVRNKLATAYHDIMNMQV